MAQQVDLAEVAAALVQVATSHPHREPEKAVGRYFALLHPDGTEILIGPAQAWDLARWDLPARPR